MKQVLLVEDEADIRGFETVNLKRAGYDVVETDSGEKALKLAREHRDLMVAVLDVNLPGMDGFEVCRRLRAMRPEIGIIMLTARDGEYDKVSGLMGGADDYMTKPFSPVEFVARVDALTRRLGGNEVQENPAISSGPFELNRRDRTLLKDGSIVKLTQIEYSIVELFMENEGKALSREDILVGVWGRDYYGEVKIVDVNVRRLRIKIENDAQNPRYIHTVWGYGYKWQTASIPGSQS